MKKNVIIYEHIIIIGENAFGIKRSGKLVNIDESSRGTYWDVEYLSSLPIEHKGIHKHLIKQTYPNSSIVDITDKRIANVLKLYINAVKEMNDKVNDKSTLMIAKNYYLINVGNDSCEIDILPSPTDEEMKNDENFKYFMDNLQKASKIPRDKFGARYDVTW